MPTLAIIGATGKLGGAVLDALLTYNLLSPSEIVVTTSSDPASPKAEKIRAQGVTVRQATFDDPSSLERAFSDVKKLFLVSTPQIQMDFNDAPHGRGREAHHFAAIDAAVKAGVKHVYYCSLLFQDNSKAGVMVAHNRTEDYLKGLRGIKYTIIREGLYNESWPLYFGHYDFPDDDREEILVAGDGPIAWTAIADLGLGNAMVAVDDHDTYDNRLITISATSDNTHSLKDIAELVSKHSGRPVTVKVVSRKEHEDYYVNERSMDRPMIEWWSKTYDAVKEKECVNNDDLLEKLLATKGRKPRPLDETIGEMFGGARLEKGTS